MGNTVATATPKTATQKTVAVPTEPKPRAPLRKTFCDFVRKLSDDELIELLRPSLKEHLSI